MPMRARILVIDADSALQELLHEFLTEEGYEVVGHCLAVADLRDVQQYQPDLILLSYWLSMTPPPPPLWQRLRMDPATARIPIIVCTAAPERITPIADLLTAGIGLVYKPFDLWELLSAVQARVTNLPTAAEP